jgi:hypothetical protein
MEFLSHHTTVEEYRLYPSQSGVVDHTYSHLLVPAGWHQVENSFTTNQPHRTVVSEASCSHIPKIFISSNVLLWLSKSRGWWCGKSDYSKDKDWRNK